MLKFSVHFQEETHSIICSYLFHLSSTSSFVLSRITMQSTSSSLRFRKNANRKKIPPSDSPQLSQALPFHHHNSDKPETSRKMEAIASDTVPSPEWSKDQCIEWIRCVFFEKLGFSEQLATMKANYWKNSGAILFDWRKGDFTRIWQEQGEVIFVRVKNAKRQDGLLESNRIDPCLEANLW